MLIIMFEKTIKFNKVKLAEKIKQINKYKSLIKNTCSYSYSSELSRLYGEADIIVDRILNLYSQV